MFLKMNNFLGDTYGEDKFIYLHFSNWPLVIQLEENEDKLQAILKTIFISNLSFPIVQNFASVKSCSPKRKVALAFILFSFIFLFIL